MDYKDRIIERYEYLVEDFEELNGRKPHQDEDLELWDEARDYVDGKIAAYADYLRKVDKGE